MTNTTHTQGPWTVSKPSGNYIEAATGSVAALTYGASKGDAQLIAAAPDMLAALEKVQDWLEGDSNIYTVQRYITNALNKAKGN